MPRPNMRYMILRYLIEHGPSTAPQIMRGIGRSRWVYEHLNELHEMKIDGKPILLVRERKNVKVFEINPALVSSKKELIYLSVCLVLIALGIVFLALSSMIMALVFLGAYAFMTLPFLAWGINWRIENRLVLLIARIEEQRLMENMKRKS